MKFKYHLDGSLPKETHWVFVFGSNLAGIHEAGAAEVAHRVYDYPMGLGGGFHCSENLQEAFGVPTKGAHFNVLPKESVKLYVDILLAFVIKNPMKTFFITRIGCGYAGNLDEDIAPMFKGFPTNCSFATQWKPFLEDDMKTDSWVNLTGAWQDSDVSYNGVVYTAGISAPHWGHMIEVHGNTEEEAIELRDVIFELLSKELFTLE